MAFRLWHCFSRALRHVYQKLRCVSLRILCYLAHAVADFG